MIYRITYNKGLIHDYVRSSENLEQVKNQLVICGLAPSQVIEISQVPKGTALWDLDHYLYSVR